MWRPPFPRVWLAVGFLGLGSDINQFATGTADWTTWVGVAFGGPTLLFWLLGAYREWEQS